MTAAVPRVVYRQYVERYQKGLDPAKLSKRVHFVLNFAVRVRIVDFAHYRGRRRVLSIFSRPLFADHSALFTFLLARPAFSFRKDNKNGPLSVPTSAR